MDKLNDDRIKTLHPAIRDYARRLLSEAEQEGIILRITAGYRTIQEQDTLYAQGRTAPGKIVTNAKGGESPHNYGLAIDVVPMVKGKPDWNSVYWKKIGQIGKSIGFAWGGDFKKIIDNPHLEMLFGKSLGELYNLVKSNTLKDGYVDLI